MHGMVRRSSTERRDRIDHLNDNPNFHLHYGDLADSLSLVKIIGSVKPDEIYNLAAQSHVGVSFDVPEYTADVVATGVLRVLEAVRVCGLEKTCRIYQASTSELYGKVEEVPQRETTPFPPVQPVCGGKAVRFLDREGVPRGLQYVLLLRYPVQPRVRAARRDVRDARDFPCGGKDHGKAGQAVSWKPVLPA